MSDCDLETAVPDWVIEHPETWIVFQELGIDTSCGGKSLGFLCRQQGMNDQAVFKRLLACLQPLGEESMPHGKE